MKKETKKKSAKGRIPLIAGHQKKKHHAQLPAEKHVEEQRYSDKEGIPAVDRPYPDYPFAEGEEKDAIKKEEEEEYNIYYAQQ